LIFFSNIKTGQNKKKIIEKIELSITKRSNTKDVIDWFEKFPPMTGKGAIDFLEFSLKNENKSKKAQMIKDVWVNANLTFKDQKYFIKKYKNYWNQEDNWKRFDRLMAEGKYSSARRALNRVKGDLRALGEARLGLSRRAGNVETLISQVPFKLKNDPGLIYERMRWRRKAKLDTAADLLLNPPTEIKNVRNWWINSRIIVRRILNKKNYTLAYNILKKHNLPISSPSGTEAEWLAGWVALVHLKNSNNASSHFRKVFNNSLDINYKSKAAYWLALSLENDNKKNSKEVHEWLTESAKNKFTFYGQNASIKLDKFNFEKEQLATKKFLDKSDLFDVVKILKDSGQKSEKVIPFLDKLIQLSKNREEKLFILEIAKKYQNKNILVKLSRSLEKPSLRFSYPIIENLIPEKFQDSRSTKALIHAIIHQESNFKINARSSAGARGLMQLMPFTAKKVTKSLKIKYFKKALTTNAQYNILLGTTYINKMLKRFDNSLPLSLAAYNAGPNRVKTWIRRYGDPRKKEIAYINWIESIPINETRYYVKKVLSNLRVYQKKYGINFYEVSSIGKKVTVPY